MKNLVRKELREKFLECLELVEENGADINEVYFVFSDSNRIIDRLHLSYSFGFWKFKQVNFFYSENYRFRINNDIAKKIIVENMCYDVFSYQNCNHNVGKVECHGHGDFWRKDTFYFNFYRFNVDNN